MKNYIFIVVLIFISSTASIAQSDTVEKNQTEFFTKGKHFLNLSITAGMIGSGNNIPEFWYILNPHFGYFFANRLVGGIEVQQSDYDARGNYISFSTGLFSRYYVPLRKVSLFVEAGYNVGTYAFSNDPVPPSIYRSGNINVGIGGQVLLGKKLGLELLLVYEHYLNATVIRLYKESRFNSKLGINYYF